MAGDALGQKCSVWSEPSSGVGFGVAQARPGAALLVLAYLRKASRSPRPAPELVARYAPRLRTALRAAKRQGRAYVVVDGTLIPVDRIAADRPCCSGKHKIHSANPQIIASVARQRARHRRGPGSGTSWRSYVMPANAPGPSSRPGESCAN